MTKSKVWFGGLEPTSSYLTVGVCSLCPLLVPFLMAPSKDKLIDRISYWKSGAFYGFGEGINDNFSFSQIYITDHFYINRNVFTHVGSLWPII